MQDAAAQRSRCGRGRGPPSHGVRMIRVIGWLLVALATPPHRIYWPVPLEQLATSTRTHVCVTGTVRYVRHQADGDVHVTLDKGRAKVVLEIIPALPLPAP